MAVYPECQGVGGLLLDTPVGLGVPSARVPSDYPAAGCALRGT